MDKCPICEIKEERLNKDKARSIIYGMPWLNYEEFVSIYPIASEGEFEKIKENLAEDIKKEIEEMIISRFKGVEDKKAIKKIIENFVMLETGLKPDNLNKKIIEKIIGKKYMSIYNQL